MFYEVLYKKKGSGAKASVNKKLPQELHKPMIKKFKRRKSISSLNIIFWQ